MARSIILCAFVLFLPALFAQSFSTLEERMTAKEFQATGLEKLSAEELAALNTWLQDHVGGEASGSGDRTGFKPSFDGQDRSTIASRIKGTFGGWSKGDVIELENGQAWEVTDSGSLSVPETTSPAVEIKPALLGSWLLKVEGYNRTARVTRVR